LGISGFIVRLYEEGIVDREAFMNLVRKSSSLQKTARNTQFQQGDAESDQAREKSRDEDEQEEDEEEEETADEILQFQRLQQQRQQLQRHLQHLQRQLQQRQQQSTSTRQGKKEDG